MKKNYFIGNIKKYTTLITDLSISYLDRTRKSDINDLIYLRNIGKRLRGDDLVEGKTFTKSERKTKVFFFNNVIFLPFTEISSSLDLLINISLYINFPVPGEYKSDISDGAYLRYHIENHLHEIYILKSRLTGYIGELKDSYNRHPNGKAIRSEFDKIKFVIEGKFKGIIDTRNEHVHEERFSDSKLDQISYLELLTNSKDANFVRKMKELLDLAHLEGKDKWEGIMKNNIDVVIDVVDLYCGGLLKILQDSQNNKEIIYPEDIK